jgi:TATA-box binding protein (TBP) (component of TFIID and TFIIIB)
MLNGCSSQVKFENSYNDLLKQLHKAQFNTIIFESGKTIISRQQVNSEALQVSVRKLLQDKKNHWKAERMTSYSPHILITSNSFSLNIREDIVVLNIKITEKHWRHYTSESNAQTAAQMMDVVKGLN